MSILPKSFEEYLDEVLVSAKTRANYRSDFSHFSRWAIFTLKAQKRRVKDVGDIIRNFNFNLVNAYKESLVENNVQPATVNRRLSTLRLFGRFAEEEGLIGKNPAQELENLPNTHLFTKQLLQRFQRDMEKEGIYETKIKTNLENVEEFLKFLRAE